MSSGTIVKAIPNMLGGSADLSGSNGTNLGLEALSKRTFADCGAIHFGVREHAMAALCNGIALHGGPYPLLCKHSWSSADYMRPSV